MPTEEQLANRRLWVADLESGDFPQGAECLTRMGRDGALGYCCLGVAAERFETIKDATMSRVVYGPTWESSTVFLPTQSQVALGLPESPAVLWRGRFAELVFLNDGAGLTLPEIGRVIACQADDWDGTWTIDQPFWDSTNWTMEGVR